MCALDAGHRWVTLGSPEREVIFPGFSRVGHRGHSGHPKKINEERGDAHCIIKCVARYRAYKRFGSHRCDHGAHGDPALSINGLFGSPCFRHRCPR